MLVYWRVDLIPKGRRRSNLPNFSDLVPGRALTPWIASETRNPLKFLVVFWDFMEEFSQDFWLDIWINLAPFLANIQSRKHSRNRSRSHIHPIRSLLWSEGLFKVQPLSFVQRSLLHLRKTYMGTQRIGVSSFPAGGIFRCKSR